MEKIYKLNRKGFENPKLFKDVLSFVSLSEKVPRKDLHIELFDETKGLGLCEILPPDSLIGISSVYLEPTKTDLPALLSFLEQQDAVLIELGFSKGNYWVEVGMIPKTNAEGQILAYDVSFRTNNPSFDVENLKEKCLAYLKNRNLSFKVMGEAEFRHTSFVDVPESSVGVYSKVAEEPFVKLTFREENYKQIHKDIFGAFDMLLDNLENLVYIWVQFKGKTALVPEFFSKYQLTRKPDVPQAKLGLRLTTPKITYSSYKKGVFQGKETPSPDIVLEQELLDTVIDKFGGLKFKNLKVEFSLLSISGTEIESLALMDYTESPEYWLWFIMSPDSSKGLEQLVTKHFPYCSSDANVEGN